MSGPDLAGKRVLVLGAETEVGNAVVSAVAEAGASVAAVAATSDAEAAFGVQRLARRLASGERKVIAQAIDATNEAAVRVMVRQVSKELGGLDGVVYCAFIVDVIDFGERLREQILRTVKFSAKELGRTRGHFVFLAPNDRIPPTESVGEKWFGIGGSPMVVLGVGIEGRSADQVAGKVVRAIAGEADSR